MTTAYLSEQKSAAKDIKKAGAPVTFARGKQTYNDSDSSLSGTEVSASSYAIRTKGNPVRLAALNLKLVQPVTLLVAAFYLAAFVPLPDDKMTFGGVVYTIKDIDPVAPDGAAIVYRITGSL